MTIDEARRVSDLLVTLDDAREWRETFEMEIEHAYIAFEEVTSAHNILADGTRGGWQGSVCMTKGTAIAMMLWLEQHASDELAALGVSSTQPIRPIPNGHTKGAKE